MKRKSFYSLPVVILVLAALFINLPATTEAQTATFPLELVGQAPYLETPPVSIEYIEAMQVLDRDSNKLLFTTRNQGADCGWGTPASVWEMILDPGTGDATSVTHKQSLSQIQNTRGDLFESSDGTLFTGSGWCGYKPPYYSTDAGETWQRADGSGVHPPNSTFSYVEFNGDVYAGTGYDPYHGQVYRWLGDAGTDYWEFVLDVTWPRTIVDTMAVYNNQLFVGSQIYGWGSSSCAGSMPVYVSSDGNTFNGTSGIPSCYTIGDLVVVGDQLVARAFYYSDNTEHYLYRWNDGLQAWEEIGAFNLTNVQRVVAHNGVLYTYGLAAGDPSKGIYRSTDTGQTWEQVAPLENPNAYSLTIHDDTLYIGTYHDANNIAYIYRIRLTDGPQLTATNDGPTTLGQATTLTATITANSGGTLFLPDNMTYAWDFGDMDTGSGAVVTHTYPATGTYTALVIASNSASILTATTTVTVVEEEPPPPLDDFYAASQDVWIYPSTLHAGEMAELGLHVHRQGGKQPISTTVRFYAGPPDAGTFIGEAETPLIAHNSSENSRAVSWTPDAPGSYDIYAVIDPDNQINESPAWAEDNNVISYTLTVLPPPPDTAPPRVNDFVINAGAHRTSVVSVTLDALASEPNLPAQSGVVWIRYEEFEYNQGAQDWVLVQHHGWLDYDASHVDYPWTMIDSPGVRYIPAWAADAARNVSLSPALDFINYVPPTEHVAAGGVHIYRRHVGAGALLSVQVTPVSGDPDLYVWPPDWHAGAWSSVNSGTAQDVVSFVVPQSGVYQIEVHGYTAAEYRLEITISQTRSLTAAWPRSAPAALADKVLPSAPIVDPRDTPDWPAPPPPSHEYIYLPLVLNH
jgi:hypothetical protein